MSDLVLVCWKIADSRIELKCISYFLRYIKCDFHLNFLFSFENHQGDETFKKITSIEIINRNLFLFLFFSLSSDRVIARNLNEKCFIPHKNPYHIPIDIEQMCLILIFVGFLKINYSLWLVFDQIDKQARNTIFYFDYIVNCVHFKYYFLTNINHSTLKALVLWICGYLLFSFVVVVAKVKCLETYIYIENKRIISTNSIHLNHVCRQCDCVLFVRLTSHHWHDSHKIDSQYLVGHAK